MKRFVSPLILVLLLFAIPATSRAAGSVGYAKLKCRGVWMNVVTVDLNSPYVVVTPVVARSGIGSSESFRSIIRRTGPTAAINGTFFCTRTLLPTGDIVIDRQPLWQGYLGFALGITGHNNVSFVPSRHPDQYHPRDFDSILTAGPTLITGGKVAVTPKSEGFRSSVHYTRRIRTAVGLTSSNKLLLITTTRPVYLSQLARAMLSLKCVEAAAMDGGSSTGLYYKGKLLRNPSRGMTNCLLIYDSPTAYEQHRSALAPAQASTQPS